MISKYKIKKQDKKNLMSYNAKRSPPQQQQKNNYLKSLLNLMTKLLLNLINEFEEAKLNIY